MKQPRIDLGCVLIVAALVVLALPRAASADSSCIPGQQMACACPGGGNGVQVCQNDGASLGVCQCAAPAPPSESATQHATPPPERHAEPAGESSPKEEHDTADAPSHKLVPLKFTDPGFSVRVVSDGQSGNCLTPCSLKVAEGNNTVWVNDAFHRPIIVNGPSQAAIRKGNATIFVMGVVFLAGGLATLAAGGILKSEQPSFSSYYYEEDKTWTYLLGVGIAASVVAIPITIVGGAQLGSSVRVTPANLATYQFPATVHF